jgi:predicted Zn-dependent protease
LDPKSLLANRALAVMYQTTGRSKEAEAHLKALVDAAPDPRTRFELVDYYIAQKRPDDARTMLTAMVKRRTTRADARTRLALLDYAAGRHAEAHALLDSVLEEQPSYPPTRIVKGRFLLAEGKPRRALDQALAAVSAAPREVRAHYLLAVAQMANGQTVEAEKSLHEVLRLNPRAIAAQVQLSRLQLLRGETEPALEVAKTAYNVAPRDPGARITLARSVLAVRDMPRAQEEIDRLLKDFPDSPDVQSLRGTFCLMRNDTVGARRAFERAIELQPGSPAGLTGLTILDVRANRLDAARARLEADLAARPGRSVSLVLVAKVYLAGRNLDKAEHVLREAIDRDPTGSDAYVLLSEVYASQQRVHEAIQTFDGIVAKSPSNIAARTMAAVLAHGSHDLRDAKQRYSAILALEPRAVVAANNLAWIYADEAQNLDLAVQLAEQAVELVPARADVRDTLGWVYYRKRLPHFAVPHFEEAVRRDPDNATFHYHLGLAYSGSGEANRARQALQDALQIDPGLAEAKEALAKLPL